jgi:hypothetical protein
MNSTEDAGYRIPDLGQEIFEPQRVNLTVMSWDKTFTRKSCFSKIAYASAGGDRSRATG